jgi:short-subunit dehydrogenase
MIEGKIVLITGASSGIGAETAKLLGSKGAVPVITGRNEGKLREVADRLSGKYGCYKLDVTDGEEVDRVIRQAAEEFGRIDVLLNNAGYGIFEKFEDSPVERFAEMMNTNYMGIVRCAKAVLPIMRRQGGGQIVNVISMAGKISTAKASAYAASKHAALGLTNAMRTELKEYGIAVSAVNPGPVDTPFFTTADPEGGYAANVRGMMLTPRRVAEAIVRVIERRTPEADLPFAASVGIRFYGLFPRFADRVLGPWINKK